MKSQRHHKNLRGVVGAALGATVLASGIVTLSVAPTSAADCSSVSWMDTSKSPEERAHALLDASSKYQMYRWLNVAATERSQQTVFPNATYPAQLECTPRVFHTDGADAVRRTLGTTAFPAPISLAATWNSDLVQTKSAAQAVESFQTGKNVILGPGIASGRTPLSGRNSEYFGEDALLSGMLGAAATRGLEDNDEDIAVLANVKHYVANEQEFDRNSSSSNIDERTFKQVYALPYEIALKEGQAESVMCSYNQINGDYACENDMALNQVLKKDMGFDGYVMSDFNAVHSVGKAIKSGLDQELNDPVYFTPDRIDAAIATGEITLQDVEDAAFRVVRSYIRGGLFDTPMPTTPNLNSSTPAHKEIARELAEQGTVLLKNDAALPLQTSADTDIALFGPTASSKDTNGISATSVCSMFNRRSNTSICEALVSPETAITDRAAAQGSSVSFDAGTDIAAAAKAAAEAEVAVVFGYKRMGEFADPTDLRLDGNGDALIEAVSAANPNTIVILQAGSAVEMPWIDDVKAVLHAWYPGEQMGPALAGLLWGDTNPSGKLPMTLPVSLGDTPTRTAEQYPGIFADGSTTRPGGSTEIRQVNFTEGLQVGYKWYDEQGIDPLFEFGYGLSYTHFDYSGLNVAHSVDPSSGQIVSKVSFTVTNTGGVAGTEIPQVYLTLPEEAGEPGKRLVGFDRIELAAGESRQVDLAIDSEASNHPFSIWDIESDSWVTKEGAYGISVAASSRDVRLEKDVLVDHTAPSVSTSLNAKQELVISAEDELSGVDRIEYSIQKNNQPSTAWIEYIGPVKIDSKSDISIRAVDAAGNTSDAVVVKRNDLR